MIDTERRPAAQVAAMARKAAQQRITKQQHRRSGGKGEDDGGERDSFVPDSQVAAELGISVMSMWRLTNEPASDFPPPIKLSSNGRNFRSRFALDAYKRGKMREAMRTHHERLNVRRRVPLPMPEELKPSNAMNSEQRRRRR